VADAVRDRGIKKEAGAAVLPPHPPEALLGAVRPRSLVGGACRPAPRVSKLRQV
jgi:hypothetical protein